MEKLARSSLPSSEWAVKIQTHLFRTMVFQHCVATESSTSLPTIPPPSTGLSQFLRCPANAALARPSVKPAGSVLRYVGIFSYPKCFVERSTEFSSQDLAERRPLEVLDPLRQ